MKKLGGKNKIFIYGLDYAGKTTILETMKHEKTMADATPTLAFNISKYLYDRVEFQMWDAPGQIKFRDIWKKGYERADLLIFVLDCADEGRYQEAREEFHKVLVDKLTPGIPLVFLYHKMDLEAARTHLQKAKATFDLPSIKNRKVVAYETSIYHLPSIYKFRSTLVDIISGTMW